jgi:hypothetical protein
LRSRQNRLRAKQSQLEEQDPSAFARPSLQISPFTRVRFEGNKVLATYSSTEYELAAINDVPASEMLDFCRRQYNRLWPKRFAEGSVAVLADMGHPITASQTVSLTLININTGEKKTIEHAPLTGENRQAIHMALTRDGTGEAPN